MSFGPGFTLLKDTVVGEERIVVDDIRKAEQALVKIEKQYAEQGGPLSWLNNLLGIK